MGSLSIKAGSGSDFVFSSWLLFGKKRAALAVQAT
jgi:hypothetical protein